MSKLLIKKLLILSKLFAYFKKNIEFLFFHFFSVGGKCSPISHFPIEHKIASTIECKPTSASECPSKDLLKGILIPNSLI